MHYFKLFGVNWDHVPLMYGRTAYFQYFELAMYGPIHFAFSHGCSPVHRMYVFELISQMSQPLIRSVWPPFASCTVDVRTYSQFQMVCTHVLWDTIELWLHACTETVRIGI